MTSKVPPQVMRARTLGTTVERVYLTPNILRVGHPVGLRPGDEVEAVDVGTAGNAQPTPSEVGQRRRRASASSVASVTEASSMLASAAAATAAAEAELAGHGGGHKRANGAGRRRGSSHGSQASVASAHAAAAATAAAASAAAATVAAALETSQQKHPRSILRRDSGGATAARQKLVKRNSLQQTPVQVRDGLGNWWTRTHVDTPCHPPSMLAEIRQPTQRAPASERIRAAPGRHRRRCRRRLGAPV